METLSIIYKKPKLLYYIHNKVDSVSSIITDTSKLERRIYKRLSSYISHKNGENLSFGWMKHLIDAEVSQILKDYRLQMTTTYSDLAITNDFGESVMYEPEDTKTNTEYQVERKDLQRKIARLASDDFERYVLTAWSLGERSIDIAKDLAILQNRDVAYFKLKVARFKSRCKKRWNVDTFTKFLGVDAS